GGSFLLLHPAGRRTARVRATVTTSRVVVVMETSSYPQAFPVADFTRFCVARVARQPPMRKSQLTALEMARSGPPLPRLLFTLMVMVGLPLARSMRIVSSKVPCGLRSLPCTCPTMPTPPPTSASHMYHTSGGGVPSVKR